ncbi:MAG: twin-arginine translocation signal domain-containing protein [Marinilabiliales bacterium]|nr:twin-arginine translocation signal domain-containing protein [Marinilabiliales bacterium]
MKKSPISRRNFLGTAAAAGAAGIVVPALITSCSTQKRKEVILPVMLDAAPDGPLLKAGLIGCGGRGTGAALNFLHCGPNLTISALG